MKELTIQHQYNGMNPQERRENCRMSMVMDRSTSIEEFPEIKSGGKGCIDTVTTFARSGLVRDGPVARCGSFFL